jgi:hypothetical protein
MNLQDIKFRTLRAMGHDTNVSLWCKDRSLEVDLRTPEGWEKVLNCWFEEFRQANNLA